MSGTRTWTATARSTRTTWVPSVSRGTRYTITTSRSNWATRDLKLLFTGSKDGSYYLPSGYTIPFYKNAGNAWKWQYDGRWTEAKYQAGEEITYPRAVYSGDTSHNNFLTSDYWMVSSDHSKLKNVELGYTFDLGRGGRDVILQGVRVYVNANNIYTFPNKLSRYGIDPETTDGSTYVYPLTRIIMAGISFRF